MKTEIKIYTEIDIYDEALEQLTTEIAEVIVAQGYDIDDFEFLSFQEDN